jgi:hypothetical protein
VVGVVNEGGVETMGLQIGFVDYVQAVPVAQLVPARAQHGTAQHLVSTLNVQKRSLLQARMLHQFLWCPSRTACYAKPPGMATSAALLDIASNCTCSTFKKKFVSSCFLCLY